MKDKTPTWIVTLVLIFAATTAVTANIERDAERKQATKFEYYYMKEMYDSKSITKSMYEMGLVDILVKRDIEFNKHSNKEKLIEQYVCE